jgi:hypothetical protein
MERVKEIYRLFKKHGFQLAGLRSFGKYITADDVAQKRVLAEKLRADAEKFASVKRETSKQLAKIPASSKGVRVSKNRWQKWLAIAAGAGIIGMVVSNRSLARRAPRAHAPR